MTDVITRDDLHLPWHAAGSFVISRNGYASLAEFETNEEAEFVVTAANAHHELVEALGKALDACSLRRLSSREVYYGDTYEGPTVGELEREALHVFSKHKAALASAEGGA